MTIGTAEQYRERLKAMKPNVYIGGRLITRDDPILEPAVNVISFTFNAAQEPQFQELVATKSHLTGDPINRFTNVHRSVDDLMKKLEMTRMLCQRVGGCIQRCMANDTLNAMGVVSKEIDEARGTEYHARFLKFLEYYQQNDLVGNAAQTDVKGDRSKRPHEQADLDLYLRVVERKKDGVVVRGAKAHNSIGPYADELLVVPTRTLTKDEGDWAVSFAIPADTPGVKLVSRATAPRSREKYKAPFNTFGIADSLTIFDDVFVPWERVFMCGEWENAGRLALLFANYHRHTYCGCKPAVTDIIMGATALVADYNGVGNAAHIRDEITELMIIAELVYASGIAASVRGNATASGIYEPAFLYSNTGRYLAGKTSTMNTTS
jgi:4-hydroxyphenylacetate 3-monooxygenase/4-hydroxybutyryl-CoA dehydratase/vinylacetyl-CoA-Delta-isomerase